MNEGRDRHCGCPPASTGTVTLALVLGTWASLAHKGNETQRLLRHGPGSLSLSYGPSSKRDPQPRVKEDEGIITETSRWLPSELQGRSQPTVIKTVKQ